MANVRTVVSGIAILFFGVVFILYDDKFSAIAAIGLVYIWFMVMRAYERRFDPVSSVAKIIWILAPYLAFALQLAILWWFQLTYGPEPEMAGTVGYIIQIVVFSFPFLLIVLDVILSKLF